MNTELKTVQVGCTTDIVVLLSSAVKLTDLRDQFTSILLTEAQLSSGADHVVTAHAYTRFLLVRTRADASTSTVDQEAWDSNRRPNSS